MTLIKLSKKQRDLVRAKPKGTVFLEGPAGTGKTTAAANRLAYLLESGVPASTILVLTPQRTLALPYYDVLRRPDLAAGGQVAVLTMGGLARRLVELFWVLVAQDAGFSSPQRRPTFLSLETAQYYMASLVRPLIEVDGYFDTVKIERNRLYSQIIDNLNKAAVVGFPHTEIAGRLKAAWLGEETQRRMYDDVQACANRFRDFCKSHNLLDFSLQLALFKDLWQLAQCRAYITQQFSHVIADNVEEDTPAAHAVLADLLQTCESALVVYDTDAGYRRFLGSDPDNAYTLKQRCKKSVLFSESLVTNPHVRALGRALAQTLDKPVNGETGGDLRAALRYDDHRYYPQMLDWVAQEIMRLVEDHGVPPGEIVVISPYLSDALRFSLMNRLETLGIPVRSHRPSRALREEPASLCLLTLAQIAHPEWGMRPTAYDVAYALITAIDGLDLVRGQLLTQIVYRVKGGKPVLSPFEQIQPEKQNRITYVLGERYDLLRQWLANYSTEPAAELDIFFSRLFGEVLSQRGFGFYNNFDRAETAANLISSAQKFRHVIEDTGLLAGGQPTAQEYVQMVQEGVIADQYIESWTLDAENAVLVAPAYTFLMSNRPVDYQFWLNVGSSGWSERLYQPLTHPYVLSLQWHPDQVWTDTAEVEVRRDMLYRLVMGLVNRCRKQIYLGFSELGEQGDQQRGELLQMIYRILRRAAQAQNEGVK